MPASLCSEPHPRSPLCLKARGPAHRTFDHCERRPQSIGGPQGVARKRISSAELKRLWAEVRSRWLLLRHRGLRASPRGGCRDELLELLSRSEMVKGRTTQKQVTPSHLATTIEREDSLCTRSGLRHLSQQVISILKLHALANLNGELKVTFRSGCFRSATQSLDLTFRQHDFKGTATSKTEQPCSTLHFF